MSRPWGCRSEEQGFSLIELLVVILLASVIAGAVTSVIISTTRTQTFTNDLRTVMDDGRISLGRMRSELREARRVLSEGSSGTSVRFWLDRNQDGIVQDDELICYAMAEIGNSGFYELLRWDGATEDAELDDCAIDSSTGLVDARPAAAQTIARTLTTPTGIFTYEPCVVDQDSGACLPNPDANSPRVRLVTIEMVLDVRTEQGPDAVLVETTVRLRNVH